LRSSLKKMMDYCTFCPKMCRFSCPTAEATEVETYTPWGKMEIGRWLVDKTLPLSQDLAKALYQCTNCLHCQRYCEHDNDVPSALAEVRRMAVENYAAPPEVYEVENRFAQANNPYGRDLYAEARPHWPDAVKEGWGEVLFFPSCHTLRHFPQRLGVYFEIFRKLKVQGVQLTEPDLQCCGAPLDALGFADEFQEVAEVQYHALGRFNWVVTDGPECGHILKKRYPELSLPLGKQALHLMEFLAPYFLNSNHRSRGNAKARIAYHDPPYLSRYLGLSELPRRLLGELTGFAPLELSWSGEDTLSAGTEGAYSWIFPAAAEKIARRTVEEVESRGIGKLLTADPLEEAMFKSLKPSFEVQDFFEFLNEQLLSE
jgi:Fe-S oxidoreductase